MSDITEQATQEELADSLVSEPEETQPEEHTGTETAEVQEVPEQEVEQTEEEADDWLPDEQEKVFPDEVLAKYAQRYNIDLAKADPQTRQLVIDKINSDIYLKTLQTQQEEELPEIEEEEEAQPEPIQQAPQLTFDQHIERMTTAVKQSTSPDMANWFYRGFMESFGVPKDEIDKLAPAQAQRFTEVASVAMLNLINTFGSQFVGAFVPQYMEQQYPQLGEIVQTSSAARSWDSIRNSSEAELPAYGTKEYSTAARKIGTDIAGSPEAFERMVFTGRNGQPLSQSENLRYKQQIIAQRMARGEQPQIPPALMAQAVKTGEKAAARKLQQKQAGNLSAGKSRSGATSGDDDFWAEGLDLYQKQHGTI